MRSRSKVVMMGMRGIRSLIKRERKQVLRRNKRGRRTRSKRRSVIR